jgi:thiol-disulfide isomerase/thioredoxin
MKKLGMVVLVLAATLAVAEELGSGAKAPGFSVVNATDGGTVTMKPDDAKLKVVVFTCNQCPYAKAFEPRLIEIANRYGHKGVSFYAVNPNDDSQYSQESLANMKARAEEKGRDAARVAVEMANLLDDLS